MAVPKQRKTKSRQNNRRMHIYLKGEEITTCKQCGEDKMPHRACANCGFYNGKSIIKPKNEEDEEEKEKRDKGKLSMENLSQ